MTTQLRVQALSLSHHSIPHLPIYTVSQKTAHILFQQQLSRMSMDSVISGSVTPEQNRLEKKKVLWK